MRVLSAAVSLMFMAFPAMMCAQARPGDGIASRTEVGVVFTYLRSGTNFTNTGQSSGFSLTGVSATGAYKVAPRLQAVLDLGGTHVNGIQNTGLSLTLLSYLAGARYSLRSFHKAAPFAQALLGGVHATGGEYPANTVTSGGADGFAMALGGGVDVPVTHRIALRGQADYFYTKLPNGSTNYQSNLRAAAGFVVHFGGQ